MAPRKSAGADGRRSDRGPGNVEQLAGRLDNQGTGLRRGVQAISTPREALKAMLDAGARFKVQDSRDLLGPRFSFEVGPDGDRDRCRGILADAKQRPAAFFAAFKAAVQAHVREGS